MKPHLAPGLPLAGIQLAGTFNSGFTFFVVRIGSEHRPCPALAFDTVTDSNDMRFAGCRDAKRAALALGNPVHPGRRYSVTESPTISRPPPAAPAILFRRHRPAADPATEAAALLPRA